jgi:hypothetical protein
MKENFSIVIESYHIADRGTQENVSDVVLTNFDTKYVVLCLQFQKSALL